MGTILVTGGSGFVGSHLVSTLCGKWSVLVFDKVAPEPIDHVAHCRGDLTSIEDLYSIDQKIDGIIHLGGISRVSDGFRDPLGCLRTNVMGTANILEYAKRMDNPPWIILGGTVETPSSIYGLSKHMAELTVHQYVQDFGLRAVILRFACVYGSHLDKLDKVIPKLMSRAMEGKPLFVDNGLKSFDFIHIDDLVRGILAAVDHVCRLPGGCFETIPLATGKNITLEQLTSKIVSQCCSGSEVVIANRHNGSDQVVDPTPAESKLGFKANIDLEQGLRQLSLCLSDIFPTDSGDGKSQAS